MIIRIIVFLLSLVVVAIFKSCGNGNYEHTEPVTDFLTMEGTLITHPFPDKVDTLSDQKVLELQDKRGLTLWFGRYIYKDVCITGDCRMIRLWLFWDGAGNYLGLQLNDNEPLTKSDHTEFESEDYEKLDTILKKPYSILKDLKSEELTIETESDSPSEADGYTGATQPTLAEEVVRDAVYTCHTLWHTVYGPTRTILLNILDNRVSTDYLSLMFESENPAYILWALRNVDKLHRYHEEFYPFIMELIKSDNFFISKQALDYFQPFRLNDKTVQEQLVALIPEINTQEKYNIIRKFVDLGSAYEDVVLFLLESFQMQDIGVNALSMIYRLILPEYVENNKYISEILQNLSMHDNPYIRNLTNTLLKETSKAIYVIDI